MWRAKGLGRERRRKPTGVPDFQPVGEKHDLDGGIGCVVAVGDGIDDGFGNRRTRQFVGHGGLIALGAGAHGRSDPGHHEVHGLVHKLEHRAFINLIVRDRLGDCRAVEMKALDLRRNKKALGLFAEEQNGCMARLARDPAGSSGPGPFP